MGHSQTHSAAHLWFSTNSASAIGIELVPANSKKLITLGMAIIESANQELQVHHPERPEVNTIDVTEFFAEDSQKGHGTSVVIYGESHMDRCASCSSGSSSTPWATD